MKEGKTLKRIDYLSNGILDQVLKLTSRSNGNAKKEAEQFLREKGIVRENEKLLDIVITGGLKNRAYIGFEKK